MNEEPHGRSERVNAKGCGRDASEQDERVVDHA